MGHTQAAKAQTHERVVRIAARRIREHGLDALSIGEVMKEAGLTHGGFYKHFASREDLVTAAVASAIGDSQGSPGRGLQALLRAYLSPKHRDDPGTGCAVSALASDAGRASPATRALYTEQVGRNVQVLETLMPGDGSAREDAIVAFSAMVGAVALSRAVSDRGLADEILKTVRARLEADLCEEPRRA